jgi:hypothetical protein
VMPPRCLEGLLVYIGWDRLGDGMAVGIVGGFHNFDIVVAWTSLVSYRFHIRLTLHCMGTM